MSAAPEHNLGKDEIAQLIKAFRTSGAQRLRLTSGDTYLSLTVLAAPATDLVIAQLLSPSVGIFAPQINRGASISSGEKIGVIKRLNSEIDILAAQDGTVQAVTQAEGAFVEYGAPVFEIALNGAIK